MCLIVIQGILLILIIILGKLSPMTCRLVGFLNSGDWDANKERSLQGSRGTSRVTLNSTLPGAGVRCTCYLLVLSKNLGRLFYHFPSNVVLLGYIRKRRTLFDHRTTLEPFRTKGRRVSQPFFSIKPESHTLK